MIGLNHGSWSVRHQYDGQDMLPLIRAAYERKRDDPAARPHALRLLQLATVMGSLPAEYFQYYYFKDEVLAELQAKPTTRAQDILAAVPDYWQHYREQAALDARARPAPIARRHQRAGAGDRRDRRGVQRPQGEVWPVNVPNCGAIADFPDDLVVEVPGYVDRGGVSPIVQGHMPRQVASAW